MKEENEGRPMGKAVKFDEARIGGHLVEMVQWTVASKGSSVLRLNPSWHSPDILINALRTWSR
jgi:hypothetical protein